MIALELERAADQARFGAPARVAQIPARSLAVQLLYRDHRACRDDLRVAKDVPPIMRDHDEIARIKVHGVPHSAHAKHASSALNEVEMGDAARLQRHPPRRAQFGATEYRSADTQRLDDRR